MQENATKKSWPHSLSWRHSGFSVHGDVTAPDRYCAARLGRYMIRCPLVLERLSLDEATGEVLYRTRPSRAPHAQGQVARWDVYELIARVLDCILVGAHPMTVETYSTYVHPAEAPKVRPAVA